MKKVKFNIYYFLEKKSPKVLWNWVWLTFKCTKYDLIKKPQKELKVLYHIKDETWETNYAPPVFECVKERVVIGRFPSQDIFTVDNGVVTTDSDMVFVGNRVYWDKFFAEDFNTSASPRDNNLFLFTNDCIYAKKRKREYIEGTTFSLIGLWSWHWAHFLYQFLGKLYYAGESGLLNQDINILTNDTNDANINQIIDDYLLRFPKAKRILVKPKTEYKCEHLIFAPSLANNYNDCNYYLEYRFLTPKNDIDIVMRNLVDPLVDKVKNYPVKYKKIFLPRKNNTNMRYLNNNDEVEDYFRKEGFHFIECSDLSLEEKADIFSHAEIIVGLNGASFFNMLFCTGAKLLSIVNNRYATDMLGSTLLKNRLSAYLNITGKDDGTNRESNFTVSLDKIKRAYKQLLDGTVNKEYY
jgi:hypothetical protein